MQRIPLARPHLGEAELDAVARVISSGQLTRGPVIEAFEQQFSALHSNRECVAVSSGTAALHLALLALGVGEGDDVVVPAYTFPATANVVAHCGARAVFCDIEPGIEVASERCIREVLTPQTRAIMVVHQFGFPAPVDDIVALARERGIAVIEDAAGALGTRVGGQLAGTIGDVAAFSFHPRKLITCGEGGALTFADSAVADRARALRTHGFDTASTMQYIGLNYRLSDIAAATLLPQLDKVPELIASRAALAAEYAAALDGIDGIDVAPEPHRPGDAHSWQAYVARVRRADRDRIIAELGRHGIESTRGGWEVPALDAWQARGADPLATPNARIAADRGLALPLWPGMREDDVDAVAAALHEILDRHSAPA